MHADYKEQYFIISQISPECLLAMFGNDYISDMAFNCESVNTIVKSLHHKAGTI